ncbi:MAG TPA: beta-N-acetylhexosaminidase [Prolixibacteraceae bacterium]|jgi:hexosaminidase
MSIKTNFSILLLTLFSLGVSGQDISIIPQPLEIKASIHGNMRFSSKTMIVFDAPLIHSASFLKDYCNEIYRINLLAKQSGNGLNNISLVYRNEFLPGAYTLDVDEDGIRIQGSEDGVFYGIQSLIQLMPVTGIKDIQSITVPFVNINDQPRFAYRGMLLDVGRHFFAIDFLKKCVDYAAFHKINYFHLHLTDDQGWRIEIKKYPKLAEVGAWRNGTMIGLYPGTGNDGKKHGGYYTQEELKDLVSYAQKRYVSIVPEIEMPGHALAALSSYPNLGCTGGPYQVKEMWGVSDDVFCAGNDSTFSFLQDVLDEVIAIFPSKYIHIGGDECPKKRWEKCPKCQARIKAENLKDEHELQSYFISKMEKYVNEKGRTIIGWDEILEGGIAPNAVVMSWRGDGEFGCLGAVKAKHPVIMAPSYGFYLDYPQTSQEDSLAANWGGVSSVRKTYMIEPVLAQLTDEEVNYVIGAQANIWTEYMNNLAKVEYMMFPRLSAVSEVLWSAKKLRNWDDFKKRMESQYLRYNLWRIKFNPANLDIE